MVHTCWSSSSTEDTTIFLVSSLSRCNLSCANWNKAASERSLGSAMGDRRSNVHRATAFASSTTALTNGKLDWWILDGSGSRSRRRPISGGSSSFCLDIFFCRDLVFLEFQNVKCKLKHSFPKKIFNRFFSI